MADIIMPKMSDAMTEGKVLAWRKQAGDPVRRGETIAEIETDKVNVEIDAEADGTLADIIVPAGGTAPVGAVIAHINGAAQRAGGRHPGEAPQPHQDQAGAAPGRGASVRDGAPAPASAPEPPKAEEAPRGPRPAPAAARGRDGPDGTPPDRDGEAPKASPLARRLAAERSVDLKAVHGTGPGGRIVERDVLAAAGAVDVTAAHRDQGTTPPDRADARPAAPRPPATEAPPPEYDEIELSRMRQAIALSVAHSVQVTPHFYVTGDVDMGRVLDVRSQLNDAYGDEDGRVTINDVVLKAAALALRRHPDLNAQFIEPKTLRRFRRVHLGIMVALPDGLVAPVLRDADRLTLRELAREARRLIQGAQHRRLKSEDFTGATFSVSNLGTYPVANFAAIINAPQAGILAVGRVEDRPAVRDGTIVPRPTMGLTISADHRVTDGTGAAALLAEVKRLLEHPMMLLAE
jgi:pyruvate dehydrogenase E2 component (dihydrolipoamide acetyltransferase)